MTRAVAFVVLLTLAVSAAGQATTLSAYAGALERLHERLTARQYAEAKAEALQLKGVQVSWPGGTFRADDALLDEIAAASGTDRALLLRIEATVAELRAADARKGETPDPKLLRQVAAEQDVPHLVPGGEITTKVHAEIPFFERIATAIEDILAWIGEKLEKLIDWLLDLLPRSHRGGPGATAGMRGIVWFLVALIVLVVGVLAWTVARRTKGAAADAGTSVPFGSRRDDDPLSRGATEWERYAAQLAAAGRHREAIRAWYHAVLVTSYSAGILQFRKGRTNWEYVATLPPSLPWRPEMISLTRRFEREWYGADESGREALEECREQAAVILESLRERGAA